VLAWLPELTRVFTASEQRAHKMLTAALPDHIVLAKDSERTRERHARMDRVLKKTGVHLVVWRDDQLPHASTVRDMVLASPGGAAQQKSPGKAPARPVSKPGTVAAKAALARELDAADEQLEEFMNMRDPVPSTLFDDFDSGPTPLSAATPRRTPGAAR
jgi:hypothetical protein